MKCPRCPGQELLEGGILSASNCPRCGGGLLPDDGAQRLLVDDLGHDRAQLQELAALVGGTRLLCPSCNGRMSPIQLRGAPLDLCFQCGALWVDAGELERVSAGRYRLARAITHVRPEPPGATRALVRVDERPPWMRVVRNALGLYGGLGVAAALAGSPLAPTLVFTLPALLGAAALARKRVTDVLPRAGRVRRWRGVLPPDKPDTDDELPSGALVRVSALPVWRGDALRRIELVDPEGRIIVTLHHVLSIDAAERVGEELARALGVTLRQDVPRPAEPLDDMPAPLPDHADLIVRADDVPGIGRMRLSVTAPGVGVVAVAVNQAPLTGKERSLSALLAADWQLTDKDGALLARMLPSRRWQQHATLLLNANGALLGHVLVRRTFFFDTVEWASPERRRLASTRISHALDQGVIRDARGHPRGAMRLTRRPGAPATVDLGMRAEVFPGATRVGVVAAAVHASLAAAVVEL
jgi:Transcription factor zinc-finger